jgi:hypothetical protein
MEAFVKIDFRLVASMRAVDIEWKLRRHVKRHGFTDVEPIIYSKEDPAKTPVESYIPQAIINCTEMVEGKNPMCGRQLQVRDQSVFSPVTLSCPRLWELA